MLQFVDLAGREQLGEEHGVCKTLITERNHINTSLYHLGHYLSGTGISKFRDTKLTMLVSQVNFYNHFNLPLETRCVHQVQ